MHSEDDPHLRDVLLDAADLPPERRAEFLDVACAGDAERIGEIQSLLFQLDAEPSEYTSLPPDNHPDRIGRYRIVEPIGEGGMGTVYRARQEHPVRRDVALKLIKLGMDTRQVVARFEAERQALAMMDHPCIARVLDAGATDAGRPYFVMDLVDGVRITEYCDANRLTIRQRLELFAQVCQAVQHAHTKGVIHRDLKPSNVLVMEMDCRPVPKVIDFGIAKATRGRLIDQTLTGQRQWLGTPQYMSPEQADGQGDVDTRGDIYSLGLLLYELLVGVTPFDFGTAGYSEIQRIIRDVSPPKPSTRLKTATGMVETITSCRDADAHKLSRLIRGELDAVVIKCLEKDRTRRYETAAALAADVQRYLRHEPVTARHTGTIYGFGKLVLRNRVAFGSAAAVMLALVAGLGAATWELRRAVHAERNQRDLRWDAEHKAYASDMLGVQQALAMNNLGRARELLDRHRPKPGEKADLRGWEWRYLWQQCRSDASFELCHMSAEVVSLSVSYDGRLLAIGVRGTGGLSVWDLKARRAIARPPVDVFRGSAVFSPREALLAYTSITSDAEGHPHQLVRLWDMRSATVIATAEVNDYPGLAFSPDGKTLLTSTTGEHGELTLWHVPALTRDRSFPAPNTDGIGGGLLAVTPDFSAAAVAPDGKVSVIDLTTGKPRWSEPFAPVGASSLAFSPDGRVLAFGTWRSNSLTGASIHLRDASNGKPLGAPLEGHLAFSSELIFCPDRKTLASASADQTIRLWDVSDPLHAKSIGRPLRGHRHEIWRLALLPDNKTLVSGAKDGSVCLWDTSNPGEDPTHMIIPAVAWNFDTDGTSLLTVDRHGHVVRRQGREFKEIHPVMEIRGEVRGAGFCDHGRFLAARFSNGSNGVWDVASKHELAQHPKGWAQFWAVTPEGHFLLYYEADNEAVEWDQTRARQISSSHPTGGLTAYAVAADRSWRIALGSGGVGTMTDATGRQTPVNLEMQDVHDACFSPDASLLAVVSGSGFVGLWNTADLAGGRNPPAAVKLGGFTLAPYSVSFSPDGRRLLVGAEGSEAVTLWDVYSQQEVLSLGAGGLVFWNTQFSKDGNVLASSNDEGEDLHVWRAPSWAEIDVDAAEALERSRSTR